MTGAKARHDSRASGQRTVAVRSGEGWPGRNADLRTNQERVATVETRHPFDDSRLEYPVAVAQAR